MWEGVGKGVTGCALPKPVWRGEGGSSTGGRRVRGGATSPGLTGCISKAEQRHLPVEGCSVLAATRTAIRVQFWHLNVWDMMVILVEGNLPCLQLHLGDMLMRW